MPTEFLPRVAARREAERRISEILSSLPPEDRRFVLENLLDAIYSAASESATPMLRARAESSPRITTISPVGVDLIVSRAPSLADRLLAWCKAHPTIDGKYSLAEAARALLPGDKAGTSKVYSAMIRSSPQSDRTPPRHPRFVWLKDESRFKLFSPEGED